MDDAGSVKDLSAREREFLHIGEIFADLSRIGPHWYWEWDENLFFTYVSEGVFEALGIRPSDVIGKPRGALTRHRQARLHGGSDLAAHDRMLAERKPFRRHHIVARHVDGSVVHVIADGNPFFDAQGNFRGYRGVSTNITQQVEAELLLRESEQRFREFAAMSADRLWETDEQHRYTYVSPTPETAGRQRPRPEALIGKFRWDTDPVLDPSIWDAYKALVEKRQPIRGFRYVRRRPNGRNVWIQSAANPMFDAHGNFRGYRGVNLEVTDYMEANRAAQAADARLRAAIEAIEDGIIVFDAEERFVVCNEKLKLYYPEAAHLFVPGTKFEDIVRNGTVLGYLHISPADAEKYVQDRMRRFHEASGIFEQQFADGRWLRVMDRKTADGGWVGFRVDITDLKRRELALSRAREEADAASRAKSEFLSSMSHELRTPMNAILGFSQLLQAASGTLSASQINDYAAHIVRSGHHLINLVNQVLDLSKIETGHTMLTIEPVSAIALVRECLDMVQGQAADAGVALVDRVSDKRLPPLSTDAGRFRQVMLNLLSNAVKYNRRGGSVTVSAVATDRMLISVTDTGDGIPLDKQAQLFQPFNRLGREGGNIEGTGIGLYLTRQMVAQLGGEIGFESAVGQGTTFWIELPLAEELAPESVQSGRPIRATQASAGLARRTVLYVEDNPTNQLLMSEIFARLDNLRLLMAGTAEEGLEIARKERPDLVIMDINLPGMSGFAALEQLSNDGATAHIPVMALTALASPEDTARGLAAGFDEYLTKPADVAQLIAAVERQLGLR